MKKMNLNYEIERFNRITIPEAREYMGRYREAARRGKVKFGKRFNYRFEWLESAWSFRHLLRR